MTAQGIPRDKDRSAAGGISILTAGTIDCRRTGISFARESDSLAMLRATMSVAALGDSR
jgi:hypothetical protein